MAGAYPSPTICLIFRKRSASLPKVGRLDVHCTIVFTDHFFAIGDQIPITWPKSDLRSDQDHDRELLQKVIGDQIAIAVHRSLLPRNSGNFDFFWDLKKKIFFQHDNRYM